MADSVRVALEHACARVDEGKSEEALSLLLEAWRERRAPEIAEVIERISSRIGEAPIGGKTVKERGEKWLALAAKKRSVDLGPLLATPWPGTWKSAMPWVKAIVRFPIDPRLALALARIVDQTPYDSWTSHRFYAPLFEYLNKALDVRTLPILEAQATRRKSSYWRQSTGLLEKETAAKLSAAYPDGPPKLEEDERAAFQALVDLFADDVKAERAKARGEADFLADIYAHPDDMAARQVFADWLTEREDPRGELITIQLARLEGRSTEAMERREASLLKKHGKAWAAALDRVLSKDDRVFEGGFLAEGTMKLEGYPKEPPPEMSDPAWATVHTLELSWNVMRERAVFAGVLSAVPNLRALRGIDEDALRVLLDGEPRPKLEELTVGFTQRSEPSPERDQMLENTVTLPSLRRVTFNAKTPDVEAIASSPFMRGVTRFIVSGGELGPVSKILSGLKSRPKPIEEIGVAPWAWRGSRWVLVLHRDEEGRFTRLRCEIKGPSSVPRADQLDAALATLDPNALTELVIEEARVCNYNEKDIATLEKRLAGFPRLARIEVPWERLQKEAGGESTPLLWRVTTESSLAEAVLDRVTRPPLSLALDSYAVNNTKHLSLPKSWDQAKAKVVEVLARPRTKFVDVYRKGASETSKLSIGTTAISIAFGWPRSEESQAFGEALLESAREMLDASDAITTLTVNFLTPPSATPPTPGSIRAQQSQGLSFRESPLGATQLGWLTALGPPHALYMDLDEIFELPKRAGFEWLRAWRPQHKKTLLLVMSDSPSSVITDAQREALVIELWSNMWRTRRRTRGFVPHEIVREELHSTMSELGFREVELPPLQRAEGRVLYRTEKYPRPCALDVEVAYPNYPDRTSFWFRALRAMEPTNAENLLQVRTTARWISVPVHPRTELESVRTMLAELKTRVRGPSDVVEHWQQT